MEEKNTETEVKVIVYKGVRWAEDWPSENLIKCIELFNEKLMLIPKEYRNSAQITFEGTLDFDDEPVTEIEIFYLRSPTKDEVAKTKTREKENAKAIRDQELEILKHLTEKYKNDNTI